MFARTGARKRKGTNMKRQLKNAMGRRFFIKSVTLGGASLLPVGAAQRIEAMGICRLRHRSGCRGIYGY